MKIKRILRESIVSIVIISIFWITYATVTQVTSWDTLTVDLFNQSMVPTWAVMAFNWNSCPNWWNKADWSWDEKNTSWEYTNLDLRWEFIRGLDDWRWVDAGRELLSSQNEDWKAFYMTNTVQNSTTWYTHSDVYMWKSTTTYIGNLFAGYWSAPVAAIWTKWDNTSEIRPRNIALLYCVKN